MLEEVEAKGANKQGLMMQVTGKPREIVKLLVAGLDSSNDFHLMIEAALHIYHDMRDDGEHLVTSTTNLTEEEFTKI